MRLARLTLIATALLALAGPARAQEDAEKSKDHPMFSRMRGYFLNDYDPQDRSRSGATTPS